MGALLPDWSAEGEAIHRNPGLDCFVAALLAMTKKETIVIASGAKQSSSVRTE